MTAGGLVFLGLCIIVGAFIIVSVRVYQVRPDLVKKLLRYALIGGIGLIFSVVAVAIGLRIDSRHSESYSRSLKSVSEIWGGAVEQAPPEFSYEGYTTEQYEDKNSGQMQFRKRLISTDMGFESQKLAVKIEPSVRTKGLLKFPGYMLRFTGEYEIKNLHAARKRVYFRFALPSGAGNITDIAVTVDGVAYTGDASLADGIDWQSEMNPGEKRTFSISYSAQGTAMFSYALALRQMQIRRLDVELSTGFADTVIPDGAMVPTRQDADGATTRVIWKGENLVTGQNIAMKFDIPGNYGKIVSKLFFYAPLAIFLFLGFLTVMTAARRIQLHPMNHLFIVTGFFIFYLLGSYLISYLHIVAAVFASLAVSTGIMAYYCFLTGKDRVLLRIVLAGAGIFQWVFSTAFFFPEHTGFLITVASIVAFIGLMRATAGVDWEDRL
jgi:hypothetical protein